MDDAWDNAANDGGAGPGVPVPSTRAQGSGSKGRGRSKSSLVIFEEAGDGSAREVPPRLERLFTYGSHAALIACLFGFAWAAGSYFSGNRSPLDILKPQPARVAASQDSAERADMLRAAQKMSEDIRALKASIESLRAAQSQTAKEAASLEGLKTRLEVVKAETGASIAELAGKVERMQREPEAKLSQIIERLDRIERQSGAALASGPGHAASAPAAPGPGKPLRLAEAKPPEDAAAGPRPPRLITNWVVRDVYNGVALVESPHGAIEVAPGEIIPGAGTVRAIERRGAGWIVITSRGLVDSARDSFAP